MTLAHVCTFMLLPTETPKALSTALLNEDRQMNTWEEFECLKQLSTLLKQITHFMQSWQLLREPFKNVPLFFWGWTWFAYIRHILDVVSLL